MTWRMYLQAPSLQRLIWFPRNTLPI
uniref:Uncharacterized protein n=1 Tax=Arundo donax TaxID=35708 RepID=A0A0A9FSF0_ARUDO